LACPAPRNRRRQGTRSGERRAAPASSVSGVSAAAVAEDDGDKDEGRSPRSLLAAPLRSADRPSGVQAGRRDGVIGKVTRGSGRDWDPNRSMRGCGEVGREDWPGEREPPCRGGVRVGPSMAALAYFEQLKISPDAWQVCAEALAQRTYSDDHIKFFCFQVLEHQVKYKYSELTTVQQQLIRETLISWLQAQMLNPQPEKTFIRNKAAQVFALLFVTEYLTKWPKFFFDILSVVDLNPRGVDLYLRILMAIDSELVDRDVEARRNTLIKDTMREQCIPNLVESWYQILQNYQYTNSEVTCQCLEVVGAYVSWIDLSLIANDRFINMLLGHMSIEVLREEACDCLFEIVNKGMDPVDKMKLVESLCQVLRSAGFFSIDQEEDVDFLARFSKLVNGMGQSLIVSWTKLIKNGDIKNAQEALQAIETKVALMLQLLIHEDDDISSNIIGFCYDYLHILKQLTVLSDQQKANVEAIMLAVMKKLTYDEEYNFENEENGYQSLLSSDDQLFIYETAGVLIVNSEYPAERKQALMRNLLTPLMEKFKILLEKLMLAQDEERQASLADCLNHAVGFASRTSKAFSNKQTVKQCGCSEVYLDCLQTFLPALSCPLQKDILRSGVRTFLHRMIICLEEEVLPFIPSASEHMLKDCEAKDLQEFIPLINQITAKFKIQVSPFLQQIHRQWNERSAENVERVLVTVIQGAVEYPDPIAQKTCFIILSKLVELWGGKDGPVGFADFVYKHIVPACFLAPLKQTFDLADAQTVLALSECAVTLKTIHLKRCVEPGFGVGPECVQYLQQEYLPSLQVAPEIIQ
ncbi:hypothetical protein E2I00_009525, partial [Balaenoptera physalus]